jgi:glycosyltransferase involved in cell wall biosynthesis
MGGRVFYLGLMVTDASGQKVNASTFTGAASNKMMAIIKAMRNQGTDASIISLPFVGASAWRFFIPAVTLEDGGVPIEFLPTFRSAVVRKILGTWVFGLRACWIEKNAKVVVYNHAIEYVLALMVLRLRSIPVVHDIEDAPTTDERGLRKFLSHFSFWATNHLTLSKKMVVAEHVAKSLNIQDCVVIRGVAGDDVPVDPKKWTALRQGGPLVLHFGGTLNRSTGIEVFCAAVKMLSVSSLLPNAAIEFNVTGVGELEKIQALQQAVQGSSKVRVNLHTQLSKQAYQALFGQCHGSLSLRDPVADYSNTTFPSKVIEITSSGLALVSSKQGDVPDIYNHEAAFLMDRYDPECLADLIIRMAANPSGVEEVAQQGKAVAKAHFSGPVVARQMQSLLQ